MSNEDNKKWVIDPESLKTQEGVMPGRLRLIEITDANREELERIPGGIVVETPIQTTKDEYKHGKLIGELKIQYDPMHEEFFSLIKQMCETFLAKNLDYAGSDAADMMKNFMRCENFGIAMSDGIVTRMSDKITRMENLMRTRKQMVKDESLLDTVMDLSNYCLLLAIALKREKKNEIPA